MKSKRKARHPGEGRRAGSTRERGEGEQIVGTSARVQVLCHGRLKSLVNQNLSQHFPKVVRSIGH